MLSTVFPAVFATSSFSDENNINPQYQSAIEYVVAQGVLSGYADGSFRPKNGLTRGAASKLIASLKLGAVTASELGAQKAPFSDVPESHTFAGCIWFCTSINAVSGYADGTFKPSAPLTGYAFAKMLLSSIGYASNESQYVGTEWKSHVYTDAVTSGIYSTSADFTLDDVLTREAAAWMLYNAMMYKSNPEGSESLHEADDNREGDNADSPAQRDNILIASVDGVQDIYYLGGTSEAPNGTRWFYMYKLRTGTSGWKRIGLGFGPQMNDGENFTKEYDKTTFMVSYSSENSSAFRTSYAYKGNTDYSVTLEVNQSKLSHVEGSFWAIVDVSKGGSNVEISGSFVLNYDEYVEEANKLDRETQPGLYGGNNASEDFDDEPVNDAPRVTYVDCSHCGGDGKCTSCGGDGHLGWTGSVLSDLCGACRGDGKCIWCKGTGRQKV